MLNTNKFITKIRDIIIAGTSFTSAFTPDLPQTGTDICCVTLLTGSTNDNLCNTNMFNTVQFRVLIRGTENDITTRVKADEIFNCIHLLKNQSFTGGTIINIIASSTPIYVGRDNNENILYNITFNANII